MKNNKSGRIFPLKSGFLSFLRYCSLVVLTTIVLSGCGSGGGGGGGSSAGNNPPANSTTAVIASGTVGPNGGTVADSSGETAVIVPPGAVTGATTIQITRGRDADGYVVTNFTTSAPTSGDVRFILPDPILLESSVPKSLVTQAGTAVTGAANWFSGAVVSALSGGAPSPYPIFGASTKFLCDESKNLGQFEWYRRCSYFWRNPGMSGFGNRIDDPSVAKIFGGTTSADSITYRPATVLSSSCDFNDQTCYQGKEAVLFVHGFIIEADLPFGLGSDNGFGGGSSTWGQFPGELQKAGYVPFEFRWVTAARFEDVAGDLAKAIDQIAERTGKKVHIIAHSMGGVLSRVYLQKIGSEQGYQFNGNVASLTTLGSPHSGIFSSKQPFLKDGILEAGFNPGQDNQEQPSGYASGAFQISHCDQLSCYQLGQDIISAVKNVGMSSPGEMAYKLWKTSGNLPPVPIQALIGLTASRSSSSNSLDNGASHLDEGDGLISYEGQRFLPGYTWDKTTSQYNSLLNNELVGSARVTERILGFGGEVVPSSGNPLLGISSESVGYRHTGGLVGPGDAIRMACAGCEVVSAPDHSGVKLAAEWIKQHPAGVANLQNTFFLHVRILDKNTSAPVTGATITATTNLVGDSAVTDQNGDAIIKVQFMPLSTYDLFMELPGYGAVRLTPYNTARIETTNTPTLVDRGPIMVTIGSTAISTVQHSGLTVSLVGTGSGSVIGRGIACPVDCVTTDVTGAQIILVAKAEVGSTFGGWSGCTSTSGVNCYVTLDADKAVSATFTRTMAATSTIAVGPASLNFGSVPVGTCTTARVAIQHVNGTDPASGTVNVTSGTMFSVTSGSNFLVASGNSALVDVRFCPTGALSYTGVVTVTSSASFMTANTVTLSGSGSVSTTIPLAPSTLTASTLSQNNIALIWMDQSDNETGFRMERKTGAGGIFAQIATSGPISGSGAGGYYEDTGLTAGTTYCYRILAYNAAGDSAYTPDACAATLPPAVVMPTVTTGTATNIAGNSATLNAAVNPNGIATGAFFQWGTTISYGNTTPSQVIGSGTSAVNITANLTGLTPNTVYHFRVVATNGSGGTTFGDDQTFTTTPQVSSVPVKTSIAGGSEFTLAIKNDGTVWAWGNNPYGQLGDGTTTIRFTPVQVSGLASVTAIAGGGANDPANQGHSIALKSDGTVWAWGRNIEGQLGDGTFTNRYTPVQVSGLTGVTAIKGGAVHTLALKNDGTVWAWGSNAYGQLGDGAASGARVNRSFPFQVVGLSSVTAIASGAFHSLALKNDGTVWAWGENSQGMLGDGTTASSSTPVQVSGLTGVSAIAAGWTHTVALKSDGTVWALGGNSSGQLGNGTFTGSLTPVQVSGLAGVMAIAAGLEHTLALKNDGTVWAWGNNTWSQLGFIGLPMNTPVQVNGLTSIAAIAAGSIHSIALKTDGTIWTWGGNNYGELGDGTTSYRSTPVQVSGFTGVIVPDRTRITFQGYRNGNLGIYLMNTDGGGQTLLTNNAASDSSGSAWSPDGTRIAFTSYRDGNYEIYVMNTDGSGQTRLTNNAAFDYEPMWSPDGTKIVFTSSRDGTRDIYIMNADGSGQTRLTANTQFFNQGPYAYEPMWSPDGTKIVFTSYSWQGIRTIYAMNADGSGVRNLTATLGAVAEPAWSPDGTRIAYKGSYDGNDEIYVMNADGSSRTRLTNNTAGDYGAVWSPDSARVVFTSSRDGNDEIYVMNADGSGQTRLTNNPGRDWYPVWSPDGARIAFMSNRDGNDEIYVMNADGSGQTLLTNNPGADSYPAWSPR